MNKIMFLSLLVLGLHAANVEIIKGRETAGDSFTIGITGEIGETVPISIVERVFTHGLNSKDEIKQYNRVLTKKMNELLIKRVFEKGRYTISVSSNDLEITNVYLLQSRFIGLPDIKALDSDKGLEVLKFDGYQYLNDELYPRVYLKWGNG